MESLPAFGTSILGCVAGTMSTYAPLLTANASAIKSTAVQTFSYGPTSRHQLDVYTSSKSSSASSPILIFVHGGGFIRGSKNLPIGDNLAHANIGHFFAETFGFQVVIPDYRLIEHGANFPSGGEDVSFVVEWAIKELALPGQQRPLFLMGNSAGGVHITTFLLAPEFSATRQKVISQAAHKGLKLSAAVELSVPFDFEETDPERGDTLDTYYGKGQIAANSPLGLLRKAQPQESDLKAVPFLLVTEELDPQDEILNPNTRFTEAWAGKKPDSLWVTGHNHISPALSLGTGIEREEKWGHDVGKWLESKI